MASGSPPTRGDDLLAVRQRRADEAPRLHRCAVVRYQVVPPQHAAVLDRQGRQVAGRTEHVDAVAVDGGCGARAVRVGGHETGEVGLPGVIPELLSGGFLEHDQALTAAVPGQPLEVGREHASLRHRGAAVARPDRRPPDEAESVLGEALENAGSRARRRGVRRRATGASRRRGPRTMRCSAPMPLRELSTSSAKHSCGIERRMTGAPTRRAALSPARQVR